MNRSIPFRIIPIVAAVAFAAGAIAAPARVQVSWAPSEQLSENRDNQFHHGWLREDEWKKQISDYFARSAARVLPADEQLDVSIDNIKLAGDFEPWHGPNSEDIRFLKDIYPPRIDLHFRLLGPDGRVLSEGSRKLRDFAYLQRATLGSDPLRYDKRMIDDWMGKEFGRRTM